MIEDRNDELATLHALGLLEGDELARFEKELAGDPALRKHVEELRTAAASLAHLAPAAHPPQALKDRILATVGRKRPAEPVRGRVLPFPNLIPWAVAACLAVSALWSGRLYLGQRSENALIREQQKLADIELRGVRDRMEAVQIVRQRELDDAERRLTDAGRRNSDSLREMAGLQKQVAEARLKFADACVRADDAEQQIAQLAHKLKDEGDLAQFKIATLASMLGNSPQAVAVAVWNPMKQQGMLKVSKLAMPASDKDYELWAIDPQYASPVCCGLVSMDPSTGEAHVIFTAHRPINGVAKFAISLENKGGMPEPHGPIVMLSE